MKTLLRLLLKSQHQRNRSGPAQKEKGMTLVELLVGSIMAFLIITPMLGFVVDMLNTDRREQVKSNTEQDLQAAVDFIAQDLSQAIYIYDNIDINGGTRGTVKVTAIKSQLPANDATKIPILVFWKRQQIKNAVPIDSTKQPSDCSKVDCNDTYVLSLVAYYQLKDSNATWCQPSGPSASCPTRIARYEIRDGVKNPYAKPTDSNYPYYYSKDTKDPKVASYAPDPAFSIDPNKSFDLKNPTVNVTNTTGLTASSGNPQVLVNYIDHTTGASVPQPPNCKDVLGVVDPTEAGSTPIKATDLLITDGSTHSFYACVDNSSSKNIARVTIRGNSLRRLQANDADFKTTSSAFFPTATVQVQGLGARGK